jgi:hypothetical protein
MEQQEQLIQVEVVVEQEAQEFLLLIQEEIQEQAVQVSLS